MNNIIVRIITGVVGGAIVVGAIRFTYQGLWLFGVVVSMISLWEFLVGMKLSRRQYQLPVLIAGACIWVLILFSSTDVILIGGMMIILPVLEILFLFYKNEKTPPVQIGLLLLGFFYCLIPLILYYKMSVSDDPTTYDFRIPLGILILTWALDTSAFFIGKGIGRHALFPRVSPKKTWEGAIGGAICCMIAGVILYFTWPISRIPEFNWLIVAGIIAVFSQLGDLVESLFKRSMDLKDSGRILPGHGGMLDRFDGFMLSMPFLYFYYILI